MRDMQTAVCLLLDRAGPHLTREELQDLTTVSEQAEMQAHYLRTLAESIGCAVNQDGAQDGIFQSKAELSALMWHIAGTADTIAALIDISQRADCLLLARPYRQPGKEAQP